MTYLLDVSTLLAWLWSDHEHHERVIRWQKGKSVAICPITELGFVRISTQPTFGATMNEAREMLSAWYEKIQPDFVSCDLKILHSTSAATSGQTTDFYLASLAEKHGMNWATLDGNNKHQATFLLPD
ncbi:MAG TPA: PIN domain-containing protein [Verrucomicrobiae bacterium]|jgi:predicted nucleic acid-binding protein